MLVNRYRRSYHRLRSLVRHQVERLKRNAISMHAIYYSLYHTLNRRHLKACFSDHLWWIYRLCPAE